MLTNVVYIITDCGNSPGKIYLVTSSYNTALTELPVIEAEHQTECDIEPHDVIHTSCNKILRGKPEC